MPGVIDAEARDRIAKLWTEHRELSSDYWGVNRDNGRRSVIDNLEQRIHYLEIKIRHYEDTRVASCLGLAAIEDLKDAAKKEEQALIIERERGRTMMMVQWVQVFGIVAVAIIALLKP